MTRRRHSCPVLLVLATLAPAQSASDPKALLQSAIEAEQSGRTAAAIRQFRALLGRSAPLEIIGQARLELVRIHGRRAEWFDAAEQLQELRKLAPDDPEYAYELGVVYRNLSKSAFERMQSVAPQSARVEQMFGEQYAISGETAKAIAAYGRAIAADPGLPGSHLALALIYLRQQKRQQALAEVDRELALSPESAAARQVRHALTGAGR